MEQAQSTCATDFDAMEFAAPHPDKVAKRSFSVKTSTAPRTLKISELEAGGYIMLDVGFFSGLLSSFQLICRLSRCVPELQAKAFSEGGLKPVVKVCCVSPHF